MPCNCDHMQPTQRERESRKVIELMREVNLYHGEVPYYGQADKLDSNTAELCRFCQNNDVSKYSLELQIWWRDHQKADEERAKREAQKAKTEAERKALIDSLSDYEKGLLGIDN